MLPNAQVFWIQSNMSQDFPEVFIRSSCSVDEEYGAARAAEKLFFLQSQQIWEVLLRIMVHKNQVQTLSAVLIQKQMKCSDYVGWAGCQHLKLKM